MTPTAAETLLSLFATAQSTPVARWDELMAYFVLGFRMEREAGPELGRAILQRVLADAKKIETAIPTVLTMTDAARRPASVTSAEVYKVARSLRRLSFPQAGEVVSGIEKDVRALTTRLVNDGTPVEDLAAAVTAAEALLSAWTDLKTAYAGAQNLGTSFAAIPPLDAAYLSNKMARSLLDSSRSLENGERRPLLDAILSSHVFTRLLGRSITPDNTLFDGVLAFTGQTTPPSLVGSNSGPFAITALTNGLTYTIVQNGNPLSASIPAKPDTVIPFASTDVMGRYVLPLPAGNYTFDVASSILQNYTVSFTLVTGTYGEVYITAANLAQAINTAQIPGVTAQVVTAAPPQTAVRVQLVCTDPMSGPSGWLSFLFGNTVLQMGLGIPSLVFSDQWLSSADLASAANPQLQGTRASASRTTLVSGNYAFVSMQIPNRVTLTKGTSACTTDSEKVYPTSQGFLNKISVGDECWLRSFNSTIQTTITEIDPDGFKVALDPMPPAGLYTSCTVNPTLGGRTDVNYTLEVGGRAYRFTSWQLDNLKKRYVTLGTRGHYYPGYSTFQIVQDVFTFSATNDTSSSYLFLTQTGLQTEIGLDTQQHVGVYHEIAGDFTEVEGFRSRVEAGDIVDFWKSNLRTTVTFVEDGKIGIASNVEYFNANPTATIRIYNWVYDAWTTAMAGGLPSFDDVRYAVLLKGIKVNGERQFVNELVAMTTALQTDLAAFRAPLDVFVALPFKAKSVVSMLNSFKAIRSSRFYDLITKGDLTPLTAGYRQSSVEGETAEKDATVARGIAPQLTPLERIAISVQEGK